jgi:hypothetical protein
MGYDDDVIDTAHAYIRAVDDVLALEREIFGDAVHSDAAFDLAGDGYRSVQITVTAQRDGAVAPAQAAQIAPPSAAVVANAVRRIFGPQGADAASAARVATAIYGSRALGATARSAFFDSPTDDHAQGQTMLFETSRISENMPTRTFAAFATAEFIEQRTGGADVAAQMLTTVSDMLNEARVNQPIDVAALRRTAARALRAGAAALPAAAANAPINAVSLPLVITAAAAARIRGVHAGAISVAEINQILGGAGGIGAAQDAAGNIIMPPGNNIVPQRLNLFGIGAVAVVGVVAAAGAPAVAAAAAIPLTIPGLVNQAFCLTPITSANLQRFVDKRLVVPFGFLLVNPACRYAMDSLVVMRGGDDCGNTKFSMEDFQLAMMPDRKFWAGFYTLHHCAFVKDPRCVIVAPDVRYAGYIGGETTNPVRAGILNPLPDSWGGDMFYFLIPYNTRPSEIPTPLSFLGYYPENMMTSRWHTADDSVLSNTAWQYESALYYNYLHKLQNLAAAFSPESVAFRTTRIMPNVLCFQATQYNYDPKTGQLSARVKGSGHHGDFVYEGVGRARSGQITVLREGGDAQFMVNA